MSAPGSGVGLDTPADWRRTALTMYSPLSAILRQGSPTVPLDTSVKQTLEVMARENVEAVVVVDQASEVPLGTFTTRDLVRRVDLAGGDLEQPVACVMTGGLVTLGPGTTAHQAALTMARLDVRHLVVVDGGGRLLGVVSRDDLFGLQRVGVDQVSEQIRSARDLPSLQAAAAGIRRLADGLLAQGTGAETLLHFITTLDDLLTIRVLETTVDERELPGVPWCWIGMGSEGRMERTFSSDQDNALILDAGEADGAELRRAFQPFAKVVNDKLEACGFPVCDGHSLASDRRRCLTLDEWRRAFEGWLGSSDPGALADARTFLDFRPIYGQVALADRLREQVLPGMAGRREFLRQLAVVALQAQPPLSEFGTFVYDSATPDRRSIDLKQSGSNLFADAARVLGLARGTSLTSTVERLRAVADTGLFGGQGVAGLIDAFHFIHLLRLRNQIRPGRPGAAPNRISPRDLNELDRHILLEAFRQARRLQEDLVIEFRLR